VNFAESAGVLFPGSIPGPEIVRSEAVVRSDQRGIAGDENVVDVGRILSGELPALPAVVRRVQRDEPAPIDSAGTVQDAVPISEVLRGDVGVPQSAAVRKIDGGDAEVAAE